MPLVTPAGSLKLLDAVGLLVAAPLVLDSIGGLPGVVRWCVLVQREIAELMAPEADARIVGCGGWSQRKTMFGTYLRSPRPEIARVRKCWLSY